MKILFGGDFNFQEGNLLLGEKFKSILNSVDGTILNLEGYVCPKCDTESTLCMPGKNLARVLEKLKVIAVSLANNHSLDGGKECFEYTKEFLRTSGISVFGLREKPALSLNFIEIYGVAWDETGVRKNLKNLINAISLKDFFNLRFEEDKFIVFFPHWGIDLERLPLPWQVNFARNFVENFRGIIVGHHSHLIQPVFDRRVFFSVGNLWMPRNAITGYYPKDSDYGMIIILNESEEIEYYITHQNGEEIEIIDEKRVEDLEKIDLKDYKRYFVCNRSKKHYPLYEGSFTDFFKKILLRLVGSILRIKFVRKIWINIRKHRG